MYGQITLEPATYYEGFIAPWLNPFSLAVGLFTTSIFTFLAAAYLIGEAMNVPALQQHFQKLALASNVVTVIAGGLVFLTAVGQNQLISRFTNSSIALLAVILATLALPVFWWAVRQGRYVLIRLVAGFQILMVILAWLWVEYPILVHLREAEPLTVYNTAAPDITINTLGIVLIIGVLVIFPLLGYLLYTFKRQETLAVEL